MALFKDTSDLKKGDLNYGNMFDIYKFPNVLYTVKVTGAEMKAYMEWAAACWNQWQPGDINISFNPDKPGYLHDHLIGLNYEVNLSKPAGERIENVTFKGQPLTDDMTLTLCVNDYRYTGLKNEGIISGEKEWESSASVRDMLVAYLAEHDPLEPKVDHNWKITGVDLQKDNPERAAYIEKINSGELATPYNKSINLNVPNNVIVNGVLFSAATAVDADGNTYYRLRDLATAFNGTTAQFRPVWLKSAAVDLNKPYTERALALPEQMPVQGTPFSLAISADGNSHLIDAILVQNMLGGNYYVTVEGINTLLGINAVETNGVLTLTADKADAGNGNAG